MALGGPQGGHVTDPLVIESLRSFRRPILSRRCGLAEFWGLLGAVLGPLGASFGPLGRLLGRLGGLLGPLWGLLGAFWGGGLDFSVLGSPLEPLLGPSWGLLVRLGRHLGRLGGPLGPFRGRLGSFVGRLGAILGASWAVLERPEAEKARTQKTLKKHMKFNDFGSSGPSWEVCWRLLGAS